MRGGTGDDVLSGGFGDDILVGQDGDDDLHGEGAMIGRIFRSIVFLNMGFARPCSKLSTTYGEYYDIVYCKKTHIITDNDNLNILMAIAKSVHKVGEDIGHAFEGAGVVAFLGGYALLEEAQYVAGGGQYIRNTAMTEQAGRSAIRALSVIVRTQGAGVLNRTIKRTVWSRNFTHGAASRSAMDISQK